MKKQCAILTKYFNYYFVKSQRKKSVRVLVDSNKGSLADFVIVLSNPTSTITETKDRHRGFPASPMGI